MYDIRKPKWIALTYPDMFTPTLYWPMVESSLGIVGACLPLFRPLIRNIYPVRSIRKTISFPSGKKPLKDARTLEDGRTSSSALSSEVHIYAGGNNDR